MDEEIADFSFKDVIECINSLLSADVKRTLKELGITSSQALLMELNEIEFEAYSDENLDGYSKRCLGYVLLNKLNQNKAQEFTKGTIIESSQIADFISEYTAAYNDGEIEEMLEIIDRYSIIPIINDGNVSGSSMTAKQKFEYLDAVKKYLSKFVGERENVGEKQEPEDDKKEPTIPKEDQKIDGKKEESENIGKPTISGIVRYTRSRSNPVAEKLTDEEVVEREAVDSSLQEELDELFSLANTMDFSDIRVTTKWVRDISTRCAKMSQKPLFDRDAMKELFSRNGIRITREDAQRYNFYSEDQKEVNMWILTHAAIQLMEQGTITKQLGEKASEVLKSLPEQEEFARLPKEKSKAAERSENTQGTSGENVSSQTLSIEKKSVVVSEEPVPEIDNDVENATVVDDGVQSLLANFAKAVIEGDEFLIAEDLVARIIDDAKGKGIVPRRERRSPSVNPKKDGVEEELI